MLVLIKSNGHINSKEAYVKLVVRCKGVCGGLAAFQKCTKISSSDIHCLILVFKLLFKEADVFVDLCEHLFWLFKLLVNNLFYINADEAYIR